MTSNKDVPGTRLVISNSGSALLATTSGRNGTRGSLANAFKTPISLARRSAAGRDHANLAIRSSPTIALEDHHTGSPSAAGSGTRTSHRSNCGATLLRASPTALAVHSASHLMARTLTSLLFAELIRIGSDDW
jgi:hypothetical protein